MNQGEPAVVQVCVEPQLRLKFLRFLAEWVNGMHSVPSPENSLLYVLYWIFLNRQFKWADTQAQAQ